MASDAAAYLPLFFLALEAIGLAFFIIATVHVFRIGKTTGWFNAWYAIAAAMLLVVLRRVLSGVATGFAVLEQEQDPLDYANSVLLLTIGVAFAYGFGKLYCALRHEKH
jgi:hypothetical protein